MAFELTQPSDTPDLVTPFLTGFMGTLIIGGGFWLVGSWLWPTPVQPMAELRLSTYGQFYTTAQGRPASPQSPIGSGHAMVGSGVSSYDFTDTYPIYSSDAEALEVSFSRSGNNGAFFQD